MAELKKSVVAKVAADVKEAVKAVAPAAEAKKEEVKKEAPAKKAPAKKAAAPKKETVKKAAAPKKEAAKKAEPKKEEVKKEAPAKKVAAKKAVAKVAEKVAAPKETIAIQFAGKDYASDAIIKLCKESYKATKNKAALKKINVYVNIDDSRAYYVVNDEFHGSVEI